MLTAFLHISCAFAEELPRRATAWYKISKPLVDKGAKWESHSKFKLSGMLSRVPKRFKDAGSLHR